MRTFAWVVVLALLVAAGIELWWPPSPAPGSAARDEPAAQVLVRRPLALEPTAAEAGSDRGPWIELNNRAVAAIDEGRLDQAIELLERCVAGLPGEEPFATNLSRALVRRATDDYSRPGSDRARAIDDLARAVELAPDDAELAELLDRWRRQAGLEADFARYESEHFSLSFDGDRDDLLHGAQDVIDVLEPAYLDLWLMTGHDPVVDDGRRLRIVLYRRDEFHAATGLGHWAGGSYDGSIRIPVDDLDAERAAWSRTLRHELAHAFVASVGGTSVPGWLNEGFAQWFEGGLATRLAAARERLGGRAPFTLDELHGSLAKLGDAEAIGRAYAQSLLLVDHLERFYGERLLGELLAACGRGSTPQAHFEAQWGFALDEVVGDLDDELAGR